MVSVAVAMVCALLCVVGVSLARAGDAPPLTTKKARALILKYVKGKVVNGEEHGTPSNWGVVPAADCVQTKQGTVKCAWGLFWADGHECFNLRRVTAHYSGPDGPRITYTQKNLLATACDDDGSGNGGKSGRGTATDIDPGGQSSRTAADDGEEDDGA
jgi:hypothetical protein